MKSPTGRTRATLSLALVGTLAACGGGTPAGAGVGGSALVAPNGLTPNGLARNGLAHNGLAHNGLAMNGLARNGLARNGLLATDFRTWFDADPVTGVEVMTYLVRCAVPAGQILSYTSPTSGIAYAWAGSLGLAPGWASGLPATEPEEQVVSACLAAHVNKFGIHLEMSVQGLDSTGKPIPLVKKELDTFAQREGCFFGNLFRDEGVSVGLDHPIWDASVSSARACAFDIYGTGLSADCPPIDNVGPCWLRCKADAVGNYYTSCGKLFGGAWKTYLPITTRVRASDVYRCGDGACQFTETCGTGTTAQSCAADCGTCDAVAAAPPSGTKTTTKLAR